MSSIYIFNIKYVTKLLRCSLLEEFNGIPISGHDHPNKWRIHKILLMPDSPLGLYRFLLTMMCEVELIIFAN